MLKLNQQSSFKADLKLAMEKVIIIQSIPGVLYHSAKNLGFQGNADPQVWHSLEEAPEVSKVLSQVWSESTACSFVARPTQLHGEGTANQLLDASPWWRGLGVETLALVHWAPLFRGWRDSWYKGNL